MDLISREAALAILYECGGDEIAPPNMIEMRGRMYKLPAVDAVSRGLYEQIKWERDIAMEQLAEHGIAFGAKAPVVDAVEVVRCEDCVSSGGDRFGELICQIAIHEYVDYGSAIGALLDVVREHGEETDAEATIKRCIMALSGLPRFDPASLRAKGEWEMRGGKRYCTHCGERACVTRDTDDFWYTKGTDFCPNCGADMRGNPHDS